MKRLLLLVGCCFFTFSGISYAQGKIKSQAFENGSIIQFAVSTDAPYFEPLQKISIKAGVSKGSLLVVDASGTEYVNQTVQPEMNFLAGGAIGRHFIYLKDAKGKTIDKASFVLNCKTQIKDADGFYEKLLSTLYWSMLGEFGEATRTRVDGKFYTYFVGWLRDHTHTMKGMKYFYPDLKSGFDLYADYQRKDGMIWDNLYSRNPEPNYWDVRFKEGNFIQIVDNGHHELKRIPVEADVEYLFVECLYYTWKATGDDQWMQKKLDNAIKAVKYCTTDPYRWSQKYNLIKRGHTIDTWDFQADPYKLAGGDQMLIDKDHTQFGVMFGDNTGMIASCRYLAEMLEYAGRSSDAAEMSKLADNFQERLDKLAWNGRHYTHWVPENPDVVSRPEYDLGVDEKTQVSLSNAYSVNRGIGHDKSVAIIKTYQDIRRTMPATSPGEWYTIYPIYPKGYGGDAGYWEYMNGGVISIVAGELAHGAFEHGYETYGVDILKRLSDLAAKNNNYLHCTYRGAMPEKPIRSFTQLRLNELVNADFKGTDVPQGVKGWTSEGENDMRNFPVGAQIFQDIPFEIINPADNDRKAVLAVSSAEGYAKKGVLPVNTKSKSIYLLHTKGGNAYAGNLIIHYADSSIYTDNIMQGKVGGWWFPEVNANNPSCRVAWWGANPVSPMVGAYVYGLNNPYPDKEIASIEFEAAENGSKWMIMGVTLSDKDVFFMPDEVSFGIPDNWGAAACVYALIEGLAGVKDEGTAFSRLKLSPRWEAAGVQNVSATVKYEASGAYVSYIYSSNKANNKLEITFTGNSEQTNVQILLPAGKKVASAYLNGKLTAHQNQQIEQSDYVSVQLTQPSVKTLTINLQ